MIKLFHIEPWLFLFLIMSGVSGFAQNFNSKVEAVIHTNDAKNDILEITGSAKNKTEINYSLRYELSVITSDGESNNASKNSQSGRFTLEPFDTKNLSTTAVSIDPTTRTIILLLLYNLDDELMGTARKVYAAVDEKQEEKELSYQKPNEGIKLKGMVTENTKTIPGKNFYDFFYQKYSLNPDKSNEIVKVEELISFGRTTRLVVKVGDQIIYQFYARPKLDYLRDQADAAMKQLNRYFQYLKNRLAIPRFFS